MLGTRRGFGRERVEQVGAEWRRGFYSSRYKGAIKEETRSRGQWWNNGSKEEQWGPVGDSSGEASTGQASNQWHACSFANILECSTALFNSTFILSAKNYPCCQRLLILGFSDDVGHHLRIASATIQCDTHSEAHATGKWLQTSF